MMAANKVGTDKRTQLTAVQRLIKFEQWIRDAHLSRCSLIREKEQTRKSRRVANGLADAAASQTRPRQEGNRRVKALRLKVND
ncbi:MAG: hypothetical protein AAFR82_00570 [Pseudomonadota bacterium]